MPTITTTNLTKYYIDKKKKTGVAALYKVNLCIPNGSFTVVMGASGCGKTTLLRALTGLTSPDEGQIFFDECEVTAKSAFERNVSYLSQEYALYPHLTVFDNVAYPLKIAKVPAEEIRCRVLQLLNLLGMDFLATRKPKQLSGGQQQRVCLARALIKNPDVLFLDEPLSNLDAKLRAEIVLLLKKIHRDLKLTVVYVTHNLRETLALSDYLVVMDNGSVLKCGDVNETLNDREVSCLLNIGGNKLPFENNDSNKENS